MICMFSFSKFNLNLHNQEPTKKGHGSRVNLLKCEACHTLEVVYLPTGDIFFEVPKLSGFLR